MKTTMRMPIVGCVLALLAVGAARGQAGGGKMPRIIEKDGRHALLVDGQPFFMLGGQAHNSSAWPGMLPQVWSAIEAMHANTLEVPIYWGQIETRPGQFDFSLVDTLLKQGREHNVRLVLLWFAIWKAAAPAIDLLAPDIYLSGSERVLKVLELYDRPDNPLFVPEIGSSEETVRYLYAVLAHGGIGFSPFGIDDNGQGESQAETQARLSAIGQEYAMISPMMREIAK